MRGLRTVLLTVVGLCLTLATVVWADDTVFARVNGVVLTKAEVDAAVYMTARQRFYHGRMDEVREQKLRREVVASLIDRSLLIEAARTREVVVDAEAKQQLHKQMLSRYDVAALPQDHRQKIEAELLQRAEEQLLLQQLEREIKTVAAPESSELKQFYLQNIEKFTMPSTLRLSVILLKVAPGAPSQAWKAAEREAEQLRQKIIAGTSFADLARMHSGDASAENGGDLGVVHQGMLSRQAQVVVDGLAAGQLSQPVVLLQGVALFRLEERQASRLNPLAQVRERAQGLYQRERAEKQWQDFLGALRAKAEIEMLDGEVAVDMIWAQGADVVQQ